MTFRIAATGLAASLVLLAGCATAPQMPVPLAASALGPQGGRIGVAMAPLPKVDTEFPGAACLLCMAAASVANSSLTKHTQTLTLEDLPKLKELVAERLRGRGADVQVIADDLKIDDLPKATAEGPNLAPKDYSALQKKYGIDKLMVIRIDAIGITRSYSAYIPTSDPKATVRGLGFLVDLKTNAFDWYQPINVTRSAEGAWDEPPKFPGLTNAYFQVLELGKDEFVKAFKP